MKRKLLLLVSPGIKLVGNARADGKRSAISVLGIFVDESNRIWAAMPQRFTYFKPLQAYLPGTMDVNVFPNGATSDDVIPIGQSGFALAPLNEEVQIEPPTMEFTDEVPGILSAAKVGDVDGIISKKAVDFRQQDSVEAISVVMIKIDMKESSSVTIGALCQTNGYVWGAVVALDPHRGIVLAAPLSRILQEIERLGFQPPSGNDFVRQQTQYPLKIEPASTVFTFFRELLERNSDAELSEWPEFTVDHLLDTICRLPRNLSLNEKIAASIELPIISQSSEPTLSDLLKPNGRLSRIHLNYCNSDIYEVDPGDSTKQYSDPSIAEIILTSYETYEVDNRSEVT